MKTGKPKTPKMTKADSSAIHSHAYNAASRTLQVKFHNGGLYEYSDVSPEKYGLFAGAESLGKHFAQHIRGAHEYKRLDA